MQNTIPAITGSSIAPLLLTSKWEPFQDRIIQLKANEKNESSDTGGWELNVDPEKLHTYSQQVECAGIKEDSIFFVDLSLTEKEYDTKDKIITAQEDWAFISKVISANNQLIFYIYENAVPSIDLTVTVRFANTDNMTV